jgi:putative oxidoreductase
MTTPTQASSSLFDTMTSMVLLVGRLLLPAVFLHEGIAKLGNYAGSVAFARAFGVPEKLLPVAIAVELGGGLCIALGIFTRSAALALAGFCLVTAFVFHTKFTEINQLLHFQKNLAIAGGLLVLVVAGPGTLGIGWRLRSG